MGTVQATFVEEQMRSSDVTGSYIIGNEVTGSQEPETGIEREIISHAFYQYVQRFLLPGTPLDSRYEQWNFESNQS
jgi:hypothetical protein